MVVDEVCLGVLVVVVVDEVVGVGVEVPVGWPEL